MPRNIRLQLALLFAAIGLGLVAYGAVKIRSLPVYTESELALSTELNLSLDLARIPIDKQPPPELLAERRKAVRAEVEADAGRSRSLAWSWLQTGLVLMAMALIQYLVQRWTTRPARS